MKKAAILLSLTLLFVYGCSEDSLTNENSDENYTQETLLRGPGNGNWNGIVHHVSVGGNDACEAFGLPPGCDGNFSLVANKRADGTVTGQWNDTFNGGGNGIHVTIDCLKVEDNWAIVSGINNDDGLRYTTILVDNGTSNNDPDDQISYSWRINEDCNQLDISYFEDLEEALGFDVFLNLTRGQVKVW